MYEVGTYNSEAVAAARWLRCKMAARGKVAECGVRQQWGKKAAPAAARGKVAAAAKPFFERQRNESRVGGGPHGDLL